MQSIIVIATICDEDRKSSINGSSAFLNKTNSSFLIAFPVIYSPDDVEFSSAISEKQQIHLDRDVRLCDSHWKRRDENFSDKQLDESMKKKSFFSIDIHSLNKKKKVWFSFS